METEEENQEFTVWATVKMRGAYMVVSAKSKEEARDIAEKNPDFELSGAEMSDWEITGVAADACPPLR